MKKRVVLVFLFALLIGFAPSGWAVSFEIRCSVREIAFSPSEPRLGIALTSWGTLLTRNGEHWTTLPGVKGTSVVFDPRSSRIYLATASGSLEVSADEGRTWQILSDQFAGQRITTLAVDPIESTTMYAGILGRSVFRSTDGGETWRRIYNGIELPCPFQILVGPHNRDVYVVSGVCSDVIGDERAGVFHSSNGGEDWDLVDASRSFRESYISAIAPIADAMGVYIASGTVLHRSDRSRISNARSPQMPAAVYSIWPVSGERDAVLIGTDEGLWRQSEKGRSKLLDGSVLKVTVPRGRPEAIYASTSQTGILYSLDHGKTWQTGALCPESSPVP